MPVSDLQAVEGILQDIQNRIQRFSSQRQSFGAGEYLWGRGIGDGEKGETGIVGE